MYKVVQGYTGTGLVQVYSNSTELQVARVSTWGQGFRSGTVVRQGYGCSTVVLKECMVIGEQVQNRGTAVVQGYSSKGVLQGICVQE